MIAFRGPAGVTISICVPSFESSIGTQAYPMFFFSRALRRVEEGRFSIPGAEVECRPSALDDQYDLPSRLKGMQRIHLTSLPGRAAASRIT